MQTAPLPLKICDDIKKITRNFVWGSTNEKRKIHLLRWEDVRRPKEAGGLGMRSMRQVNGAFMAKLGFRSLKEPEALWSRVIRHKYCKGRCDVDMFQNHADASRLWKGIVKAKDTLLSGVRAEVRDGRKTFFWSHAWATSIPLGDMAEADIEEEDLGRIVAEYWNEENWKWEEFAHLCNEESLLKIAEIRLVEEGVSDNFMWGETSTGKFTISTAIGIMRKDDNDEIKTIWSKIWKTRALERAKHFVWLTMHDAILSNANRYRRHLTTEAECKSCGERMETTLHILRDCSRAKEVWIEIMRGQTLAN